ncbi:SCO family protein [Simiduia sp. 21SJ11W-1]|uniref:SCO family protein n=1 Tax=Simiduia sp. 21SJ11W-1 TaxID=2909669 RepID=UPI00209D105E|nr:SCO family protein [Simiduia sp. 21SJ11W-1]UTA47903.1 SCO family protein [Simiduia sp. 21SJ11W-1]
MSSNENLKVTQKQQRGIRLTITAIVVFIVVVMLLFLNKILTPRHLSPIELQVHGAIEFEQPRRFKDFTLVDQHNQPFERSRLEGKWSLVFFGFTHCPDICPTTMATLAQWYDGLPEKLREQTQVILVTVDPARDTPAVLAEYVPYFHQDFIGVTGEFLPIKRFATQLNVAFTKVVQGDSYTMDHSGHVALVNAKGDFHGFFKAPLQPDNLTLTYSSMVNNFPFD